jgi:hypothetical protein
VRDPRLTGLPAFSKLSAAWRQAEAGALAKVVGSDGTMRSGSSWTKRWAGALTGLMPPLQEVARQLFAAAKTTAASRLRAAWTEPGVPDGGAELVQVFDARVYGTEPPKGSAFAGLNATPEDGPDRAASSSAEDVEPIVDAWIADLRACLTRRADSPAIQALTAAFTEDGLVALLGVASLSCAGAVDLLGEVAPASAPTLRSEAGEALTAALLTAAREVLGVAETVIARASISPGVSDLLLAHARDLEREIW